MCSTASFASTTVVRLEGDRMDDDLTAERKLRAPLRLHDPRLGVRPAALGSP